MGAGKTGDETASTQSTEVTGHLVGAVGAEQLVDESAQLAIAEGLELQAEETEGSKGSPKRSAETRWQSAMVGHWRSCSCSVARAQSSASRSVVRRRRLTVWPIALSFGMLAMPLGIAKSAGSLMVVSVRRARTSLKYCLT